MSVLDQSIPCYRFFEELSAVPRGSCNEEGIAEYLARFASDRGLDFYTDEKHNVVIRCPGSAGRENEPPLMLQCHTDMVCEKNRDCAHDFKTEPLDLYIENGWLRARGTTLGADDGAGMSYILSILDDGSISKPPIQGVFTAMEEVGMLGAAALAPETITARRMIGLDGGGETATCVSSSGGADAVVTKPCASSACSLPCWELSVGGLRGGHSGVMIDRELGNSIKLGFRALARLRLADAALRLVSFSGGLKNNAIPREFSVVFASAAPASALLDTVSRLQREYSAELEESDPGVTLTLSPAPARKEALTEEASGELIDLACLLPNGQIARSLKLNIPAVSLNVGVCALEADGAVLHISIRSPMESRKDELIYKITLLCGLFGAQCSVSGGYPGWAYSESSPLRDALKALFEEKGQELLVGAVHGGLETGIWKGRYPDMDIITYGPIAVGGHTPDEALELASFLRSYENLLELLKRV